MHGEEVFICLTVRYESVNPCKLFGIDYDKSPMVNSEFRLRSCFCSLPQLLQRLQLATAIPVDGQITIGFLRHWSEWQRTPDLSVAGNGPTPVSLGLFDTEHGFPSGERA